MGRCQEKVYVLYISEKYANYGSNTKDKGFEHYVQQQFTVRDRSSEIQIRTVFKHRCSSRRCGFLRQVLLSVTEGGGRFRVMTR